ncbi:hypothetical protein BH09BAC2_BH09BAC2_09100 [soil metagenome]
MKRIFIPLLALLFAISSCSTSRIATQYKNTINGTWVLQSIVSEGITGQVKANLFNEQSAICFNNSIWTLNSHTSLGTYTTSKTTNDCGVITRNIRWSIYESSNEPKEFQFKRLDNKLKAMDNGAGYRLAIVQVEANSFQLRSNLTFEGKNMSLLYTFIRK